MKTASVTSVNYHNKNIQKSSSPSFKMNNAKLVNEGVEFFIKETHSDPSKVKAMFSRIQNHFNKIGGDALHFEIQPTLYIGGHVNVRAFFNFTEKQKVELANKYRQFISGKDYQNLLGSGCGTTRYIVNDLTKPMEIFQMSSPLKGKKFSTEYKDDKTIAEIIERSFPVEKTERKIFKKMIERPHNFFKRALRWLDTHGPTEPPIY